MNVGSPEPLTLEASAPSCEVVTFDENEQPPEGLSKNQKKKWLKNRAFLLKQRDKVLKQQKKEQENGQKINQIINNNKDEIMDDAMLGSARTDNRQNNNEITIATIDTQSVMSVNSIQSHLSQQATTTLKTITTNKNVKNDVSPTIGNTNTNNNDNNSNKKKRPKKQKALPQYDDPHTRKRMEKQRIAHRVSVESNKQIKMFAHLPQYEQKLHVSMKLSQNIYPSIVSLGIYHATGGITPGGNARCISLFNSLIQMIDDFDINNLSFSSNYFLDELIKEINQCIQYLVDCRPLSLGMGNAINSLKQYIRNLSRDMKPDEQKKKILSFLKDFILQRIEYADHTIADSMAKRIQNGDTILTYAYSSVVEMGIVKAACDLKKHFNIVIVDSRPLLEGKILMKRLIETFKLDKKSDAINNIGISYCLINSLSYVCKTVDKIFLGASSVLSNGAVISRIGVSNISLIGHYYKIPICICCETYKFSERVQIDSICYNEIGDPNGLINNNITNNNGTDFVDKHNRDIYLNKMAMLKEKENRKNNINMNKKYMSQIQQSSINYSQQASSKHYKGGSQSPTVNSLIGNNDGGSFMDDSSMLGGFGGNNTGDESEFDLLNVGSSNVNNNNIGTSPGFGATLPGSGSIGPVSSSNNINNNINNYGTTMGDNKSILYDWKNIDGLKLLNLKYDLTPAELVTMVITETGVIPPTSAPVIIREYHKDRELS